MAANDNLPAFILGEDEIKTEEVKVDINGFDWMDFLPIEDRWETLPIDKHEPNNKETNKQPIVKLVLAPTLCVCQINSKKHSVVTRGMAKQHLKCPPVYQ